MTLDNPVGSGYSSTSTGAFVKSEGKMRTQAVNALRVFFQGHPEYSGSHAIRSWNWSGIQPAHYHHHASAISHRSGRSVGKRASVSASDLRTHRGPPVGAWALLRGAMVSSARTLATPQAFLQPAKLVWARHRFGRRISRMRRDLGRIVPHLVQRRGRMKRRQLREAMCGEEAAVRRLEARVHFDQ